MKLRTAHVDLDENSDILQILEQARKLRVAWITFKGSKDHPVEVPSGAGYVFWAPPSDEPTDFFVAIREDLPTEGTYINDDDSLSFDNPHLGSVMFTEGGSTCDAIVEPNDNLRTHGALQVRSNDFKAVSH